MSQSFVEETIEDYPEVEGTLIEYRHLEVSVFTF